MSPQQKLSWPVQPVKAFPLATTPQLAALREKLGKQLCFFDLETTTFRGRQNFGITEVAMLITRKNDDHWWIVQALVNPENAIDPKVVQITGIRQDMVQQQPHWGAWAGVMDFIGSRYWTAGYNSKSFDCRAVVDENARYGVNNTAFSDHADVMLGYLKAENPAGKGGKLINACTALGIQPDGDWHRAAADATATLRVCEALLQKYGPSVFNDSTRETRKRAPVAAVSAQAENGAKPSRTATLQTLVCVAWAAGHRTLEAITQDVVRAIPDVPATSVSFALSTALATRQIPPQDWLAAHPLCASFLAQHLPATVERIWVHGENRLAPLLLDLQAQPGCPRSLDYTLLRAGLMSLVPEESAPAYAGGAK